MKTDLELLHAFRAGDRAAFRVLFRRYHLGLLNVFLALGADRLRAADLALSTFLVLQHQARPRASAALPETLRLPAPPWAAQDGAPANTAGYIYRIALLCWYAHTGAASANSLTLNNSHLPPGTLQHRAFAVVSPAPPPFDAVPDALRPLAVLREVAGLNYPAIAAALNISRAEVAAGLHTLYASLKDRLPPAPPSGLQPATPPRLTSASPEHSGPALPEGAP
jgi:DNA-directed RNA polymerase specialized sigma24 family protein